MKSQVTFSTNTANPYVGKVGGSLEIESENSWTLTKVDKAYTRNSQISESCHKKGIQKTAFFFVDTKSPVEVPEDTENPYPGKVGESLSIDNPDMRAWSKEAAIRKRDEEK